MIEQLFEVATEFRFDVGQALIGTKNLTGAVDDLSESADHALSSLNFLASHLVAKLGFGSGGLLSLLTRAVQISEEFNDSALNFANNISSNISVLAGDIHTFNDRLKTSQQIMDNISGTAVKFGVDTAQLAHLTQLIATPLALRGKLGTNYENAIMMSKNLMVGSEAAGLHPQVASESLYRALTQNMPLHGALFARMMNTMAFKQAGVGSQHQLLGMNQDKKIDLLNKALEQLAGDAEFLNNRIHSLRVQMTILKDQVAIILKPIGDALLKPLRIMLFQVTEYLKIHGKEFGDNIAKLIGSFLDDPKKALINFMQLKELGHDFKKALHFTELFQFFMFLRWGLGKLGIVLNGGLLRTGLKYLIEGLSTAASWIYKSGILGKVFTFLRGAIAEVLPIFGAFLFFLQILSRAFAIAKVNDMQNMVDMIPKFSALTVKLKTALEKILLPINMAIDFWARLIAPLFETSTWLNILYPLFDHFIGLLDGLGTIIVYVLGGIAGLTNALMGFVYDLINLQNPFNNVLVNIKEGFQDFMNAHPFGSGDQKAVVNQVTNIGKIEARFDMKEQLEPDRVAFAVTSHLKKLAMNPTQGRGQSLAAALSNPNFAGAR